MAGSLFLIPLTLIGLYMFRTQVQDMHVPARIIINLWIFGILSFLAGIGIWRVRPWGYFLFFIFILGILGGDFLELLGPHPVHSVWDVLNITLIAAGLIVVLQKHVRTPYFNPRIRWWETSPRVKIDLPTTLVVSEKPLKCQLLDLSVTGCFVSSEANLTEGEVVTVQVMFKDIKFESLGKVVRISGDPKGTGLMFVRCSFQNKKNLRNILKNLSEAAAFR